MKIRTRNEVIPIAKLNHNGVQPPWRTLGKQSMAALTDSLRQDGLLNPPCVARVKGVCTIILGHRRTTAWQSLGHTEIECRVLDCNSLAEAEALFSKEDGTVLKQGGADRLYGWAHACDRTSYMATLRPTQLGILKSFIRIFGEKDAAEKAERKTNPSVALSTYQLHALITRYYEVEECPPLKVLGNWILDNKATNIMNCLARTGKKAEATKILKCVRENKPFKFSRREAA